MRLRYNSHTVRTIDVFASHVTAIRCAIINSLRYIHTKVTEGHSDAPWLGTGQRWLELKPNDLPGIAALVNHITAIGDFNSPCMDPDNVADLLPQTIDTVLTLNDIFNAGFTVVSDTMPRIWGTYPDSYYDMLMARAHNPEGC